jgi:metal-responsive CopG/Arc/MetJ family transcriptional regulator
VPAGTRRNGVEMVRWTVTVPSNVADRVDVLLMDRGRGAPTYGARAQLISDLLETWVSDQEARILQAARLQQGALA